MIYLDNAATSFPKPPEVGERMSECLCRAGGVLGRSAIPAAQEAALTVHRLRAQLAAFLNFPHAPQQVLLTAGATAALNQAILGTLRPGDHCLVTALEHNAVMLPLRRLADSGVTFDLIPCTAEGYVRFSAIEGLIRPNTRLVVAAHGSNVCGAVQNAAAIGEIARRHGLFFLLDAAQTAGHTAVDFAAFGCSALAVPAHKGLLGPAGIGALLVTEEFAAQMRPLMVGGDDSHRLPHRFEAGTPNLPGIYGWQAAVDFLASIGTEAIEAHEQTLADRFLTGLSPLPRVRLIAFRQPTGRVGIFSLDISGADNTSVAQQLEREYQIVSRSGLHCAPTAHKSLGTYPDGTLRLSLGIFTTEADIDAVLEALRAVTA